MEERKKIADDAEKAVIELRESVRSAELFIDDIFESKSSESLSKDFYDVASEFKLLAAELYKSLDTDGDYSNIAATVFSISKNAKKFINILFNKNGIKNIGESATAIKLDLDAIIIIEKKFSSILNNNSLLSSNIKRGMVKDYYHQIEIFDEKLQSFKYDLDKSVRDLESKINEIKYISENLEKSVSEKLELADQAYRYGINEVKKNSEALADLTSAASGEIISGNYEKNANIERKSADRLRNGSLLCMFFIVSVAVYSFYESTIDSFKLESSVFRLALSFFLSIPAAYLARESNKHRQQQYYYLQTSLDLKAITPYIASLPLEDQHKIKLDVAARVFSSKTNDSLSQDSYPLNTQEIMIALLNKLELPVSNKGVAIKKDKT